MLPEPQQLPPLPFQKSNMDQELNMSSLGTNLPNNRRGLSRYYSGKARSFTCIADVRCVEDLKKPEHTDAKKRKKYSDRKDLHNHPPYPCRRVASTTQFAATPVGV